MRAFLLVFESLGQAVICNANELSGLFDSRLMQEKANLLKELSRLLRVAMRPASDNLLLHAI